MNFTRLRLHGFKSFVEQTDLHIHEGMTGIVGPNGGGKSNLVDALRWVMGEASPTRIRGAEMDDVIFGGTALRPSRNIAEVSLALDNANRSALSEFNDADELVVTRRIERGTGSDYRINGKPVRQRDVALLFADQATGAHSTSVVGQGQIDALIRAKPQDRRQILEEASGTAGLQARRHEAELKLKAAEQNLVRVDDVLHTLDTQLRGLKQQVKQASRYRNLAEHIRRTEAALMHLRWVEAEGHAAQTREALQAAEHRANELLAVVTQGNAKRAAMAAELPALRQAETAAAAIVQKLTLAREQVEAESARVDNEIKAEEQRLTQARDDSAREQALQRDGEAAVARLNAEETQRAARNSEIDSTLPATSAALESTKGEVEALDAALTALLEMAAAAEARQQALEKETATLAKRQQELTERRAQIDAQRAALAVEMAARPDVSLAKDEVERCEVEQARRQQQSQEAEQARRDAEQAQNVQRDIAHAAQAKLTKLNAEADAIRALLQHQDDQATPVIDLITVTPGLESALAVALGEALTAELNPQAVIHWRALPMMANAPALPSGATPLAQFIQAPDALARSLSQIGLVENQAEGENLLPSLSPGQILVSRDGWAWRWDGFTVTPQAKTTTALRLQQRNRLLALQEEIAGAEGEAAAADGALQAATAILQNCQALDQETRASLQAAFEALSEARNQCARKEHEAAAGSAQLTTLDATLRQMTDDIAQIRSRVHAIEEERRTLPALESIRDEINAKRAVLGESRDRQAQQRSEHDRLTHERAANATRRQEIAAESQIWQSRIAQSVAQCAALADRMAAIEASLAQWRAKPVELAAARARLLDELSVAEEKRRAAADALIAAEQKLSVTEHQLKQDETALGAAREERVRAESAVQAADEHFVTLRERMTEKLTCGPEELAAIANLGEASEWPSVFELEQSLGRYMRERDNMGPVNLRADVESEAAQADIDRLTREKDDLVAAIAKLRHGISQLNREARERLQNAFGSVNERFQVLFKRLFNGGKAHLELIDNEDPLNAGLEIFASPPGKKLQVLSLLSGGERTLTALALLFAVFQTNPSPICVLDEAEAALDETNIDRFCSLISDISKETGTRFLIITHHRLSMARMDRLYGVTMGEKGVSQLVSVDLQGAVALRDGAKEFKAAEESLAEVQAA